jgi:hypothetical protein
LTMRTILLFNKSVLRHKTMIEIDLTLLPFA